MALANVVQEAQEPSSLVLKQDCFDEIQSRFDYLSSEIYQTLANQGFQESEIEVQHFLNLRYEGTDTQIMIQKPNDGDFQSSFEERHRREFTFLLPNRDIIIDDIRVRGIAKGRTIPPTDILKELEFQVNQSIEQQGVTSRSYFKIRGWQATAVLQLSTLQPGDTVEGPAILIDNTQTIIIVPDTTGRILKEHVVLHISKDQHHRTQIIPNLDQPDPIKLSTFGHSEYIALSWDDSSC